MAPNIRPDELRVLADKLADCLNPDGNFTDEDRARRRGITIGRQDIDGMSKITGWLTPEARASWDAAVVQVGGAGDVQRRRRIAHRRRAHPSEQAINSDMRSPASATTMRWPCRSTYSPESWAAITGCR